MTMTKKVILIVVAALVNVMIMFDPGRKMTLYVGFYCDSSWGVPYSSSDNVINDVIALFEQRHPNVKVVYESGVRKQDYTKYLANLILTGKQPDVYMVPDDCFDLLASAKALEPLEDYMKNDHISSSLFFECSLSAGEYNGQQMALPFESNPALMCMNKDILKTCHVAMPDSSWTTDDLYSLCQQITAEGLYGVVDYSWINAVEAYGIDLFRNDYKQIRFNTLEMRKALSFEQQLMKLNGNSLVTSEDFDEGKVAFKPMSVAEYRTYRPYPYRIAKYSTFKWKCIELPVNARAKAETPVETSLFAMSSQSRHKELSWEFLQLLCLDETIQQELMTSSKGVSVLKNIVASDETKTIMSEDDMSEDALSPALLMSIMEHGKSVTKAKDYDTLMAIVDDKITQSLNSDSIDLDLADIEKAIESYRASIND